jgi:hypothetical protein
VPSESPLFLPFLHFQEREPQRVLTGQWSHEKIGFLGFVEKIVKLFPLSHSHRRKSLPEPTEGPEIRKGRNPHPSEIRAVLRLLGAFLALFSLPSQAPDFGGRVEE